MNAVLNAQINEEVLGLAGRLIELRQTIDHLDARFLYEISTPEDYAKALELVDTLTDGQRLDEHATLVLNTLLDNIERHEAQLPGVADLQQQAERITGLALLKALIEEHRLTGSDLPEIGDKTVVSRILSGERKLSSRMVVALGKRFAIDPGAFLQ